jgi:hypothetical protein
MCERQIVASARDPLDVGRHDEEKLRRFRVRAEPEMKPRRPLVE